MSFYKMSRFSYHTPQILDLLHVGLSFQFPRVPAEHLGLEANVASRAVDLPEPAPAAECANRSYHCRSTLDQHPQHIALEVPKKNSLTTALRPQYGQATCIPLCIACTLHSIARACRRSCRSTDNGSNSFHPPLLVEAQSSFLYYAPINL